MRIEISNTSRSLRGACQLIDSFSKLGYEAHFKGRGNGEVYIVAEK